MMLLKIVCLLFIVIVMIKNSSAGKCKKSKLAGHMYKFSSSVDISKSHYVRSRDIKLI